MFQIAREPVYAETGTWRFALKLIGVYGFARNLPPIRHLREKRWRQ
jgi:hypothetical protein